VAIIYVGSKNLLKNVPVDKVREFEKLYLTLLRKSHPDALQILKEGKITDEVTAILEKVATEIASNYN